MYALRVVGGKPINGVVSASGAKNAMTKLLIASLLSDKKCLFFNVPDIEDVALTLAMCHEIGMEYVWDKASKTLEVETKELKTTYIPHRFSGSNRLPILMIGALLSRSDEEIVVPTIPGSGIDSHPMNFHIKALEALGAVIEIKSSKKESDFHACAPHGLRGCEITLPYPSIGTTENSILAAVTARGCTIIRNAAIEPEIVELVLFLQKLGANITIDTDRIITIVGTRSFHSVEHTLMSDRFESATFGMLALATGGRIFVEGANHQNLLTFLNAIRELGATFSVRENGIEFWAEKPLRGGIHIETDVHPGFMTDWQPPFVVMLTQAEGSSIVHETVYENRFGYVDALKRMGGTLELFQECLGGRHCRFGDYAHPHSLIVRGKTELQGVSIHIPDLRAGFAHIMAALVAKGESHITGVEFVLKHHEKLQEKLLSLGADITPIQEKPLQDKALALDLFNR